MIFLFKCTASLATLRSALFTSESQSQREISESNPFHYPPAKFQFSTPAFQLFALVFSCVDSHTCCPQALPALASTTALSPVCQFGAQEAQQKSQRAHLYLTHISGGKRGGSSCNKQIIRVGSSQAKREGEIIQTRLNTDSTVSHVAEVQTFSVGVYFCLRLFAIIFKPYSKGTVRLRAPFIALSMDTLRSREVKLSPKVT